MHDVTIHDQLRRPFDEDLSIVVAYKPDRKY